jgi:hypothetical protein
MAKKGTLLPRNKKQWDELCAWVELNIFGYESTQKLQRTACLTLDGLRKGQCVANNEHDTYGEYPLEVILLTFKANKIQILNAIRGKNFESENNQMKYVCAIVRDKLNDVYSRYLNAQKSQEKVEKIDTGIMEHQGAEYRSTVQIDENKEDKFKELW